MTMRWNGLHWLAWREFARGVFSRKAPGGRDFLLLSLVLVGLMATSGILLAVRNGLVDGLAYSLLGGGPDLDLPIAVRRHGEQQIAGLEANRVLHGRFSTVTVVAPSAITLPAPSASSRTDPEDAPIRANGHGEDGLGDLTFAPYWKLEGSEHDPGFPPPPEDLKDESGRPIQPDTRAEQPMFGWALPPADPLWNWVAHYRIGSGPLPPADRLRPWLVLNLAAFRDFDYAAYRHWLEDELPKPVFDQLALPQPPDSSPDTGVSGIPARATQATATPPDGKVDAWSALRKTLLAFDHMYLDTWLGAGAAEPVRYQVIWVEGLPVTEQVTYLLPLAIHHAAAAARLQQPGGWIRWFPEVGDTDDGKRLQSLSVEPLTYQSEEKDAADALQRVADCLKVSPAALRDGLPQWLPWNWYEACARSTGLDETRFTIRPGTESAHPLTAPRPLVLGGVPCDLLDARYRLAATGGGCEADLLRNRPAFLANVLAPTRQTLFAAVPRLEQARDPEGNRYFFLDPNYRNALDRFHFVLALVEWGQWPIVLGLFAFGGYVLGIVIHGLLGHRRIDYGLLLSRGVTVGTLRALLLWQVTMAVALAALLALLILFGAWIVVNALFAPSEAAAMGRGLGVAGQQVLVFPSALELAALLGVTWLLTTVLVPVTMYFAGIRNNCEPIQLLK
jgi:hypothetical protein